MEYSSIELKKFSNDIWYPIKAIVKDPDTGEVQEVVASNIEINVPIADNIFNLQYKKGTDIWDDRTKIGFTIK